MTLITLEQLQTLDLNEQAKIIHQANIKWWESVDTGEPIERNQYELAALIISELSEALEGERKNLMDDKIATRKMAEVEMADTYIRVLDFSAGFNLFIDEDQIPTADALSYLLDEGNKGESIFHMMREATGLGYRRPMGSIPKLLTMIEIYCKHHGYDLKGAIAEKVAFNAVREDHTHEARKIAGGKQF